MEDHTQVGDFITIIDRFFEKDSKFGQWAQEKLSTSTILPLPSCKLLDVLDEKNIQIQNKLILQLKPHENIIWTSGKPICLAIGNDFGDTYCFQCKQVIKFPCIDNMSVGTFETSYDMTHEKKIIKKFKMIRFSCSLCCSKKEKNK